MTPLTTQQKLAEAEEAYHRLVLGESEVTISRNGKTVTYNLTTAAQLEKYITTLKTLINPSLRRRAVTVRL